MIETEGTAEDLPSQSITNLHLRALCKTLVHAAITWIQHHVLCSIIVFSF